MNRPLIIVLAGLVLGELMTYQFGMIGVLIPASLLMGLIGYRKRLRKLKPFLLWICVFLSSIMIASMAYGRSLALAQNVAKIIEDLGEKSCCIEGDILNKKKLKNGYQSILLKSVYINCDRSSIKISGKVRLTGQEEDADPVIEGERRSFRVKLEVPKVPKNPGAYDEKIYNYSNGVYLLGFFDKTERIQGAGFSIRHLAQTVKDQIVNSYFERMYEEDAAMLCAMVFGDKTYLNEEQKKLYQENGVAHLMAVSGLHVSGLGGRIYRALRRRGHRYGTSCFFGAVLILFYGCMTGFASSVARALLMFLIFLLSEYLGEAYDLISAMSLSGILMLLESPFRMFECGFLISYGSVLAIGLLLPWARKLLGFKSSKEEKGQAAKRIPGYLKDRIFESLVVYGVTCPIIMRFFYEASPYSIFLNPLILPFMGILMCSALLAGISGLVLRPGTLWMLWRIGCLPAVIILRVYDLIFHMVRAIPGSLLVTGCPSVLHVILIYCLEISALFLLAKKRYRSIFLLLFLYVTSLFYLKNKDLRITMLDVGQGDSILCQLPGGQSLLVDGGSSTEKNVYSNILKPALFYNGISRIDYLIVTHMDLDHMSAITDLMASGFPVKNLYLGKTADEVKKKWEDSQLKLLQLAKANGSRIHFIEAGDLILDHEIKLECLHPKSSQSYEERNNKSIVIGLKYKQFTALFTGDLPLEEEEGILPYIKEKVDLLKVAHHGSKYSTGDPLLDCIRPQTAVISAGSGNRYGHPHKELLQRLKKHQVKVYLTKNKGAIYLATNGKRKSIRYWIEKDRSY